MKNINLKELKKQLNKKPAYRRRSENRDIVSRTARDLRRARILSGLTQEELAKRMGLQQPAIARAESGEYSPGLRYLDDAAKAMSRVFKPDFVKYQIMEAEPNSKFGKEEDISWECEEDCLREELVYVQRTVSTSISSKNFWADSLPRTGNK
ncbi:MAG: helix-turn-helix transcriptional regulator [Candidatus Colwellbacteria bacterium]